MVYANPITICIVTPTVRNPLTEMEVAHTMGQGLYHDISVDVTDTWF